MASTTLLMQDILPVRNSSFHIVVYGIILLNGVVQISGFYFYFLYKLLPEIYYRPVNKYELFNLRHASARNVIERIFGVLKRRFRILLLAPEYNLDIQARIPTALCAIHNFICTHDAKEGPLSGPGGEHYHGNDNCHDFDPAHGEVDPREIDADVRRDEIAQAMWEQYQQICVERDARGDSDGTTDEMSEEETERETDDF
jgi:hypothetical protein